MSKNMYDENGILKSNVTEIEDKVKTDFGKGIVYKCIDGKEYATMEEVKAADKLFWDSLMIPTPQKNYTNFSKIEKEYFYYVTQGFDINDKTMSQEAIKELREKAIAYIQNRYGSYLSSLLDQYDYDNQEDKTQKR